MGFVLNHHHTVKNRRRAFKCWDQTEPKFMGICTGFNSAAQNVKFRDFCGAPGVKSNAGDTESIPGQGIRFHTPQGN